jgi:hypothetical protein
MMFDQVQSSTNLASRIALLDQVISDVTRTGPQFADLMRADVTTSPIPYFGDPCSAVVATIGVNPSATEFSFHARRWQPMPKSGEALNNVLSGYFTNPTVGPHEWFKGWADCLEILNCPYDRDAVHLDLSPRATRSMGQVPYDRFLEMVVHDLPWFFSALRLCPRLKAVLMAGAVTKKFYMNEFMSRYAKNGFAFTLARRLEAQSRGSTALYRLTGPGIDLPVFFYRRGPSARGGGASLATAITQHLKELKEAGF